MNKGKGSAPGLIRRSFIYSQGCVGIFSGWYRKTVRSERRTAYLCPVYLIKNRSENAEHLTVAGKRSVCIVCKDLIRKNLSELYAFLVKAVDIPCESLEHDLVLKVSEQRTQRLRNQLISDDDAGRSLSFEDLIRILVILSGCKCHDLSRYICGKLLLARCALNFNIIAPLALPETDELHRNCWLVVP